MLQVSGAESPSHLRMKQLENSEVRKRLFGLFSLKSHSVPGLSGCLESGST